MSVALRGPSAATLPAGILLLSRARGFGQRLQVEIVGDPSAITPVEGPAVLHSTVLASCGVGRELGSGSLVIVPGPATRALAVSLSPEGESGWFRVDRSGSGHHPATQQFVRLCRDRDPTARELGRKLRVAMAALGCSAEPAVLDMLFESPIPPLLRIAVALRAGRAMGGSGAPAPITGFLDLPDESSLPDPIALAVDSDPAALRALVGASGLDPVLDRLRLSVRDPVERWMHGILELGDDYTGLLWALLTTLSNLTSLPPQVMLPPLLPSMDAVAVGLGTALGATRGVGDASHSLVEIFRFLGGRFTSEARHPIDITGESAPEGRLERWEWLCQSARQSAAQADTLWRRVVDPPQ